MKIKLGIVDDNSFLIKAVCDKLAFFEDVTIKWTATSGAACLEQLAQNPHLEIILMDIEMPSQNGIEVTRLVKQKYPHIKIIMLTVFDADDHIFKAIQAGADGYFLKEVQPKALYDGIRDTLDGGAAMTPSIALKTLRLLRNPILAEDEQLQETVALTKREQQVLEQLSKGLSYTIIAEHLFVSPSTVRKHIENIYKKLQVHSKMEAVQKAKRHNLI